MKNKQNNQMPEELSNQLGTWFMYLLFAIGTILSLAVTFRVAAWILGLL